jgi:hypothetical protein
MTLRRSGARTISANDAKANIVNQNLSVCGNRAPNAKDTNIPRLIHPRTLRAVDDEVDFLLISDELLAESLAGSVM